MKLVPQCEGTSPKSWKLDIFFDFFVYYFFRVLAWPKIKIITFFRLFGFILPQKLLWWSKLDETLLHQMSEVAGASKLNVGNVTKLLKHFDEGWEELTLHELWSFCKSPDTPPSQVCPRNFVVVESKKGVPRFFFSDPNFGEVVVYLHSKGSFHLRAGANSREGEYLTAGALSEECLQMPNQCNVSLMQGIWYSLLAASACYKWHLQWPLSTGKPLQSHLWLL